jgi:predicted tellurium resistance membrane protein TerC
MLALATMVAAAVSPQGVQGFTPPSVSVSRSFSVSAASPALGHGRRTPTATATGQGQHFHSYSYYNSNGLSGRQAPASSSSSSSSSSSACYSYASMTSTSLHAFRKEEQQILETTTALHGGDPTNGTNDNAALMEHNNNNNDILEPDHIYESAIQRTIYWVAAAGVFGAGLFAVFGSQTGEEFFAGYLLEQSLSIDNLLVFLLLFEYFKIPLQCQDRVLNWGIIGAIVMRATMIGAGAVALAQFHAVLLGFAAILIYSSAKVLLGGDGDDNDEQDLSQNQIVQFSNRMIASTDQFDGDRFFTVIDGVRKATPLLICMVAVEISDVVFAVDSIPAVFGVTEVRICVCLFMCVYCVYVWGDLVGVTGSCHCVSDFSQPLFCSLFGNIHSFFLFLPSRIHLSSSLPTCLLSWGCEVCTRSFPRRHPNSSIWNRPWRLSLVLLESKWWQNSLGSWCPPNFPWASS